VSVPPARYGEAHDEEVRFAVVLNGGVSLAIWMGGVAREIDRLTRARPGDGSVYGEVLALVQARARADVIAGTSAGGINGAFLALGQAYENAERASTPWCAPPAAT
jgi:predicted acylesterase/phospholipase RssA